MNSTDSSPFPPIIELNVGGVYYTTSLSTLTRIRNSLLGEMFTGHFPTQRDAKGKYFIDRDGVLFRYVLDYLRNNKLVLPEDFREMERLGAEAEYFRLGGMFDSVHQNSAERNKRAEKLPACVTVGYRGSFAFGRDGMSDVNFRKLSRILVCGRVKVCKEVFGETLNESRDPDRGSFDDYTSRYFLKHSFLEQAFDMLAEEGFYCAAACGSGTCCGSGELKPGMDSEENKWNHYNEFVFVRH